MIFGLSSAPIPIALNLPYAADVQSASEENEFPPCLAYAVAWRETIRARSWLATLGQTPSSCISGDGGRGLCQLTSWYPVDWDNPKSNAYWAIARWLKPDATYYYAAGATGMALVKEVADSFNAGDGAVQRQIASGRPVDNATTDQNYGYDVWEQYVRLLAGQMPTDQEISP